jgi:GDP/UDP-N,N'-diacetylbacillosamine 2-epimerase (hydrolysing)
MHPERVILIENFGKNNYFSAMHYAKILIGNTSSGILEAASFQKQVINVGDRQKGRARSNNVFDAIFNAEDIIAKTKKVLSLGDFNGENIYYKEGVADNIIKIIKITL